MPYYKGNDKIEFDYKETNVLIDEFVAKLQQKNNEIVLTNFLSFIGNWYKNANSIRNIILIYRQLQIRTEREAVQKIDYPSLMKTQNAWLKEGIDVYDGEIGFLQINSNELYYDISQTTADMDDYEVDYMYSDYIDNIYSLLYSIIGVAFNESTVSIKNIQSEPAFFDEKEQVLYIKPEEYSENKKQALVSYALYCVFYRLIKEKNNKLDSELVAALSKMATYAISFYFVNSTSCREEEWIASSYDDLILGEKEYAIIRNSDKIEIIKYLDYVKEAVFTLRQKYKENLKIYEEKQ